MNTSKRIMTIAVAVFTMAGLAATVQVPSANAATSCYQQVFRSSNASKTCVKYIQQLVNNTYARNGMILGHPAKLAVDGKYGPKTIRAIKKIQAHSIVTIKKTGKRVALKKDGITGKQTWAAICNLGTSAYSKAGCDGMWKDFSSVELSPKAH